MVKRMAKEKLKESKSRVFILALDGLEYDLVVKWRLKNLMQKRFGRYEVHEDYMRKTDEGLEPYTPKVWVSFLTGKHPKEHGIRDLWTYNRILDFIRHLPVISWIKGKRKIARKLGIKPRLVSRSDYKYPTLFELVPSSKAINFIGYNEPTEMRERMNLLLSDKSFRMEQLEELCWEAYWKTRNLMFREINSDWNLFAVYFETLDWLGHLYENKKVRNLLIPYQVFDNLVYEIKEIIGDNVIFLVLSDHGVEISNDRLTGYHSHYGFWSLNINTDWKPKEITDFFHKILEWIKAETTKQFQVK